MCSARPSFAPSVCEIVSVTSAGSRSEASPTQKTPALYSGTSVRGGLERESRVLPEPPGPGERDADARRRRCARAPLRARPLCPRRSSPDAAGSCWRSSSAAGRSRPRAGRSRPRSAMSFSRCSPRSVSSSSTSAAVAAERTTWPPCDGRGDAGGEVDVVADVALLGQQRRPRVQADPHLDRAGGERLGHRRRRRDRARRGREREEERVALRVHLDAAVARRRPRESPAGARRAPPRIPPRRARAAAWSSPRRP